jgi:hypothetical protein
MALWSDDLSGCSFDEILRSQAENRAWHKEIRLRSTALINSRLAKLIERDEYASNRKLSHEEEAECKRRAMILLDEIASRVSASRTR